MTDGGGDGWRRRARWGPVLCVILLSGCSRYGASEQGGSVARPNAGPGGIVALGPALTGAGSPASPVPGLSPAPTPPAVQSSRPLTLDANGVLEVTLPSKNIGCLFTASTVRCDINDRTWHPPAQPPCYEFGWGSTLLVNEQGNGTFGCVQDTVLGAREVFPYGTAISSGPVRCVSSDVGVDCRSQRTGHGFFLARTRYLLF